MSNYPPPPPPPPPVSFNSNAAYAPFSGHPQYHHLHLPNNGPQGQSQSDAPYMSQYANAFSFTNNRQDMSTAGAINEAVVPPPPPYPGFGQGASGGLQLPYSLSSPTPRQPLVARSPPPQQQVINEGSDSSLVNPQRSSLLPFHNTLSTSSQGTFALARIEPVIEATVASDLEEGELSDGESANNSLSASPKEGQNQRITRKDSPQQNSGEENGRETAKKALRELQENRIVFLSVAAEIVDEDLSAASLASLYFETGVCVSPAELAAASVYDSRPRQQSVASKGEPQEKPNHTEQLMQSPATPAEKAAPGEIPATTDFVLRDAAPSSATVSIAAPFSVQPDRTVTTPITALKNPVSTPAISSGKPSTAKSTEKTYDRKDYIARMLAAKAGKNPYSVDSVGSNNSLPKVTSNTITQPITNAASATSKAPPEGSLPEKSPKTQARVVLPNGVIDNTSGTARNSSTERSDKQAATDAPVRAVDQVDAEAKKRAQTELARQKMEALRNRGNLQRKDQIEKISAVAVAEVLPNPPSPPASLLSSAKPAIPTATATQAASAPHDSLFSPTSGKPLFSLPGLFMSHEPSTSAPNLSHPLTLSMSSAPKTVSATQTVTTTTTAPEPLPHVSSISQLVPSSPTAPKDIKSIGSPSIAYPSTEIINSTRKRQKASDFIEPPSTRLKRHLGLSEDKDVVIEVSEDEALDGLADDDADMDIDTDQDIYGTPKLKWMNAPSSHQKSTTMLERRGSELNKQIQSFANSTPSLTSTPGSCGELKGLRSKEKEIELMNKKIAELEQRRKAKLAPSRAHTPNAMGTGSSLPKSGKPTLDAVEQSQTVQTSRVMSPAEKQPINPEAPDIIAKGLDVTSNKHTFLAEKEAAQPEEQHAKDLEVEQVRRAEADQQRELKSQEEEVARQRAVLEQKRLKESEELQALQIEEEKARAFEAQRLKDSEQRRLCKIERAKAHAQQQHDLDVAESFERQRKLERRAAIQVGLPVLDAEVEKTKQKISLLKQQINELEGELERGNKGRGELLEELQSLLTPPSASPEPTANGVSDGDDAEISSASSADADPLSEPQEATLRSLTSDASASVPMRTSTQRSSPAEPHQEDPPEVIAVNGQPADSELAGDIMDISRSDIDEGEITVHSPKPPSTQRIEAESIEHEDVYEPPPAIDTEPIHGRPVQTAQLAHTVQSFENVMGTSRGLQEIAVTNGASTIADSAAEMPASPHNQASPADLVDDSDDYEPPEPVSPSENIVTAANRKMPDSALSESTAQRENPGLSATRDQLLISGMKGAAESSVKTTRAISSEKTATDSSASTGHFTPYESALKRFKSYRYHPAYPANVRDGFRSLTYSHDIDPEKLICPYETSGTCNDDSCKYQHLNRVKLSDDMILVQLGATPSGLSLEEQDAYSRGLREVIRDIRARHVKDFNTVATEITAYRTKFLGDSTKVLPL